MSKKVADLLARMQGDFIALKGMYTKLARPEAPSNPTFDQEAYPAPLAPLPPEPSYEDYTYTKRLLTEIGTLAADASAAIDEALKIPTQMPADQEQRSSDKPFPLPEGHKAQERESGSHKK